MKAWCGSVYTCISSKRIKPSSLTTTISLSNRRLVSIFLLSPLPPFLASYRTLTIRTTPSANQPYRYLSPTPGHVFLAFWVGRVRLWCAYWCWVLVVFSQCMFPLLWHVKYSMLLSCSSFSYLFFFFLPRSPLTLQVLLLAAILPSSCLNEKWAWWKITH